MRVAWPYLSEPSVKGALEGNFKFIKEIWDRTEGKAPDRLDGPDGGHTIDLSVLSDEYLDALGRIAEKLASAGSPGDL